MIVLLCILFFFLSIIGYRHNQDIFSPYTLGPIIWFVILLLYIFSSPTFYPIDIRFPLCVFLWVIFFTISSFVVSENLNFKYTKFNAINERVWKILLSLSIFACLFGAYNAISVALSDIDTFFTTLRSINTGLDDNITIKSSGIFSYFYSALLVLYLAELTTRRHSKRFLYILLFLNLLFSFVTMAKTQFALLFICSIVVLYKQKKVKIRQLIIPLLLLLLFFVFLQILRSVDGFEGEFDIKRFFDIYLFSGMTAFDVVNISPGWDGKYTFRFFYAIGSVLGLDIPVADTILNYTLIDSMGTITNVYTGLFPFFADYGYFGVILFASINGALYGYLYKKSKANNAALIIYSILSSYYVLIFLGDFLYTNLSLFIQYVFYSLIIFYPKKRIKLW